MRKILYLCLFLTTILVSYTSCEKDEDRASSSLIGWWTDLSRVAHASDFSRINQAIANNELLSSYKYGGTTHKYYATRDFFFYDTSMWTSSDAHYGACRFIPEYYQITALHFLDGNTVTIHYAWLWDPDYCYGEVAGRTNGGTYIGDLVYYCESPRTYTYAVYNNKIIITNGDIYTITGSGLIKDGDSGILSKYDPNKNF